MNMAPDVVPVFSLYELDGLMFSYRGLSDANIVLRRAFGGPSVRKQYAFPPVERHLTAQQPGV